MEIQKNDDKEKAEISLKESSFSDCLGKAEMLLSMREHNRRELSTKLAERGYGKEIIEKTIRLLESENLLNEERYIRSFVASSNKRHPEGKNILLGRLLQKGAKKEEAVSILNEIYTEEYVEELVKKAIRKRIRKDNDMNKTILALTRSGFSYSTSKRVYISEVGTKE